MKKDKRSLGPDELRRRAEESLREEKSARPPRAGDDPQRLLHELQIYQIELEMQNDELRQAQIELEAAMENYIALYDFSPVGYMTLDGDGVIRGINLTAACLLGTERAQLIGRRFALFVTAESRASLPSFLERAIASQGKKTCEVTLASNDREPFVVMMETLACSAHRECRVAIIDINERTRLDAEVQRLNKKLQRRAFELESANQDLEAFTYTVSHDLRTPLAVIDGYCQIIQLRCGEHLDKECHEYLQKIGQGILSMNELIETLMSFSRLTRSELSPKSVDLSQMAGEIIGELEKLAPEREVIFNIAPEVTVHGDPKLLRVVLENLFGNAWKFTGKKETARIGFGLTEVARERVCYVRDNGPGFDSAHANLLFRAFQRLPGSQDYSGLGIGLATVQRIVQLHGGRVWAESRVGSGATFYFTLC